MLLKDYKTELGIIKNSHILKNPNRLYLDYKNSLDKKIEKLILLDPMNSLKRGYSILKKNDIYISSVKELKKEDVVNIKLIDGNIKANVLDKEEI